MRQTPLRSATFERLISIERRVTLIEDRPAVGDPVLLRERREVVGGESRDALGAATAAGECQSGRDPDQRRGRQRIADVSVQRTSIAADCKVVLIWNSLVDGGRTMRARPETRPSAIVPPWGRSTISGEIAAASCGRDVARAEPVATGVLVDGSLGVAGCSAAMAVPREQIRPEPLQVGRRAARAGAARRASRVSSMRPALAALVDEPVLEVVSEAEVPAVSLGERRLADDRDEPSQVASARQRRVELVGDGTMVLTGLALSDARVHEPAQRRQDVDRRVDATPLELPREHDLSLGDVAGQVRDRMRDVVVGHGENHQLGHRAG